MGVSLSEVDDSGGWTLRPRGEVLRGDGFHWDQTARAKTLVFAVERDSSAHEAARTAHVGHG
jgi:hypothetical protein